MPRTKKDKKRSLRNAKKLDTVTPPSLFATCTPGKHYDNVQLSVTNGPPTK